MQQPLSGFSIVKASYFKILARAFIDLPLAAFLQHTVPVGFQWGFSLLIVGVGSSFVLI